MVTGRGREQFLQSIGVIVSKDTRNSGIKQEIFLIDLIYCKGDTLCKQHPVGCCFSMQLSTLGGGS